MVFNYLFNILNIRRNDKHFDAFGSIVDYYGNVWGVNACYGVDKKLS
jgi:hypothetical protein